ncbi:U3 small nucleolar RNA-associated protein 4 [Yarrowia sp. B02]|nr:U3 small nucleolar RNA-associated protein 4 [Yarrowia sp. B02]
MDVHRCRFVDYNPAGITALAFSRRSDLSQNASADLRLAVGRDNGDIEIWNPRWQWLHETTLRGGKGRSVEGLAWSDSGEASGKPRLFSIGGSTAITEWNVATGQPRVNYDCHSGVIWCIAVSECGTKLAAGCENGSVVVVDLSGGPGVMEHSRVLQRHTCRVLSLAWRGNQVVGGCSDARIRVWGEDGSTVATMKVDTAKGPVAQDDATLVWTVAVVKRARGDLIVSGDSTGSVKFWDCTHFALNQSFKTHEADVLCLAVDASGDAVFSAGVDKTVACYESIGKRWNQTNVRGYNAHDVRALAVFEAKNLSLLASGGVEKVLVVASVAEFAQGPYRKFSVAPQRPQTLVYGSIVAMWNGQTVKLWRRLPGGQKRLVCKLTMSADDNISAVAMFGSLLAVSSLQETKLFELEEVLSSKGHPVLKPNKLMDLEGAHMACFSPAGELLLVSSDACILISLNEELAPIDELQVPEAVLKGNLAAHGHETEIVAAAFSDTHLALSRRSGHTEIFVRGDRGFKHARTLMRLSAAPATAMAFTGAKTLVVATADNKVVEFDLGSGLLTEWSRSNPEIPDPVASSVDHCAGMFLDPKHAQRVWMWGATWLAFVDTSANIPVERVPKRRLDGEETAKPATSEDQATTAFWSTSKYRPIIGAEIDSGDELVVVERPAFDIPLPAAFWSKKKKRVD